MSTEDRVAELRLLAQHHIMLWRGIVRSCARHADDYGRLALACELRDLADEIDPSTGGGGR